MDSNKEIFDVEFTEEYIQELSEIYEYININLKNNLSAIKIIKYANEKVLKLSNNYNLYIRIKKIDNLKREYRRIIVKNFIIIYTVDYNRKIVYVSHIIYKRRNYLN